MTENKKSAIKTLLYDKGVGELYINYFLKWVAEESYFRGFLLEEALEVVRNSGNKIVTSMELFGKRNVAVVVIIVTNQDELNKLEESIL
jgi:hypothetical protein